MAKKRLLIFYDHFYPAYKAGGPVQSLVNVVRALAEEYEFYILCKPHEMNETGLLPGIEPNKWNSWEGKANVMYWNYGWKNRKKIGEIIQEIKPELIWINGVFSLYFNLLPLFYGIRYAKTQKAVGLIVSARGMLHPGALSQKAVKKKIFLAFFQWVGWHKAVQWHATDTQELQYIKQQFGRNTKVKVAGNVPNLLPVAAMPGKKPQELIMGTVALISPMKNHLAVLQAVQKATANIQWHIYGPVKEAAYWKKCQELIRELPKNCRVLYHGELAPADLPAAMDQFQVCIMPSKSENFGHALLEALSAGKPVITTDTTPFKRLQETKAGYTVNFSRLGKELTTAIDMFAAMDEPAFAGHSKAASLYAANFIDRELIRQQYKELFSGQ